MILNSPYISGSLTVTGNEVVSGSLTVLGGITMSGSIASASYATNAELLDGLNSSVFVSTGSFNSYTSSNDAAVTSVAALASLAAAGVSSLTSRTGSYTTTSSFNSYTSSNDATVNNVAQSTVINAASIASLNSKTGSYSTTGSNTFVGGQYFSSSFNPTGFTTTASLYTDGGLRVTKDMYVSGTAYFNNVTVFGTQSIAYISSSQLNIGTNIINVNTDTPSVRFGGLAVYDSGSTGLTGSILWDSQNNHWVYSNPSGSTYSGGMFISGPRTSTLGSETGTSACMLLAGQGGDHLTSSMIYHSSTVTCIPTAIIGGSSISGTTLCTSNGIIGANSNNLYLSSNSAAGEISFWGNQLNTRLMTLTGCSNLGIGVSDPDIFVRGDQRNVGISVAGASDNMALQLNAGGSAGRGAQIYMGQGGTRHFTISSNVTESTIGTTSNTPLRFVTCDSLERFRITAAGIACFACQVCTPGMDIMPSGIGSNTLGGIMRVVTAGTSAGIAVGQSNANRYTHIAANDIQVFNDDFFLSTRCAFPLSIGTCYTARLTFAATGVACFACQVCAPRLEILRSSANNGLFIYSNSGATAIGCTMAQINGLTNDSTGNILTLASLNDGIRAVFRNDGNVGIGVSSPGVKLDVNGSVYSSGNLGVANGNQTANTTSAILYLGNRGYFTSADVGAATIRAISTGTFWYSGTALSFSTNPGPDATGTSAVERMRITSDGDVRISFNPGGGNGLWFNDTTSSAAMFYIIPAVYVGSAPYNVNRILAANSSHIGFETGGSERMRITSGGLVGIGTCNPQGLLHVFCCGYDGQIRITDSSVTGADWSLLPSSGGSTAIFRLYNRTSAVTNMTWTCGGNVGIGTTSPSARLSISDVNYSPSSADTYNINVITTTPQSPSRGGSIGLGGETGGGGFVFGAIQGAKENINFADTSGYLAFFTRSNGSNPAERIRITSGGNLQLKNPYSLTNLSNTSTTTLISGLPLATSLLISVTINWANNEAAQRTYLLHVGATTTGWGSPSSGITILSSLDWSSGYVGAATFSVGGSGSDRTLDISVANANTYSVNVYASMVRFGY